MERFLETVETHELPRVCQKYDKKIIGCQSEEIILAGFERSGVKWTAKNLEIITSHYTCEVNNSVKLLEDIRTHLVQNPFTPTGVSKLVRN